MTTEILLNSTQANMLKRLRQLRLYGFADCLENQFVNQELFFTAGFEERLNQCIDAQENYAQQRRFNNLVKAARLKSALELSDLSTTPSPGITASQLRDLSDSGWLNPCKNIVICGLCGTGKTALACALDINLCKQGRSVLYYRTADLMDDLANKSYDAKTRLISKLSKVNVLILDDFGITNFNQDGVRSLYEICDNRYKILTIIICSQLLPSAFVSALGGDATAEGITDRLVNPSIRITLEGESRRAS